MILRGLWQAVRRQSGFGPPVAALLGLAATTVGYASENLRGARPHARRLRPPPNGVADFDDG